MICDNKKIKTWFIVFLGIFSGICIGVSCFMLGSFDTDFLWHTVLRDYMVENKALLDQDIFSWRSIEMGYTEFAHSWLGSLILGTYVRLMSMTGLYYLYISVSFSVLFFIITALMVKRLFFKEYIDGFYIVICAVLGGLYSHARIQNMSHLLFIFMIYVLFTMYQKHDSKCYCLLPVISLLCANLHGGIIVLFIGIMFIFSLFLLLPKFEFFVFKHDDCRCISKKMLFITLISFITGCINPYGIKLYLYFLHVSSDKFNTTYVGEWLPVSSNNLFFILVMIALFALVVTCVNKESVTRIDLLYYGVPFGFFILSFKYGRFINYAVIAILPLLIMKYDAYMALFLNKKTKVNNVTPVEEKPEFEANMKRNMRILYAITAIVVCIACVFVYFYINNFRSMLNSDVDLNVVVNSLNNDFHENDIIVDDSESGDCILSDDLVGYLDDANYQRLFCSYDMGGRLIFAGHKSFVDSRADLFKNNELSDMGTILHISSSKEVIDKLIDKYNFDGFIFEANNWYALELYLSQRDDCILDYIDDNYIVYKRIK